MSSSSGGGRRALDPSAVRLPAASFWGTRLATNRDVTVAHCLDHCEQTGRLANFRRAAGLEAGPHEGAYYNDSDVFKVVEGAARVLAADPDPELADRLGAIVADIAAAQETDGYLYTARTIDPAAVGADREGLTRWSCLSASHELYNLGHLYEAALAYTPASGDPTLAEAAQRSLALVAAEFGPDARHDVPGHEEIELALLACYEAFGSQLSLTVARYFLEERGKPPRDRAPHAAYRQDHAPVLEQHEAVGHAVRAAYLYTAMDRFARVAGDTRYAAATDALWADVVGTKLYLTGGIGARHAGESFGDAYELPNHEAYAETCAAIGFVLWAHERFLRSGDPGALDVLERALLNGVLPGVSLGGDRFFYPNPLASREGAERTPWFACACCPTNVVRFLPRVPGFAYTVGEDFLHVNLYLAGSAQVTLAGVPAELRVETGYPWSGEVLLRVRPEEPVWAAISLRIPGWARGRPGPSDLYEYAEDPSAGSAEEVVVRVDGRRIPLGAEDPFVRLDRRWSAETTISLSLPMPVRRVRSHHAVAANRGRVAVERGPLVYCAEGVDNADARVDAVDPWAPLAPFRSGELGNAVLLRADGVTLVPYHLWAHRGRTPMAVWLPSP